VPLATTGILGEDAKIKINIAGECQVLRTRICDVLGIEHPIALGGMPTLFNSPELVSAVCDAGALGILGCTHLSSDQIHKVAKSIRSLTNRPFALNALLFFEDEDSFAAALETQPAVISIAWPKKNQNLSPWVKRAHDAGCKVTVMAGAVDEAKRAADAGADVIVAQGTEGGGHVGWIALSVLVPMVVDAVSPVPVMAAGGIADGRGFASALALGAEGVLLGTRFLASEECGLHPSYKQAILDSDGHDTVLTEIPDIAAGQIWPGAMSRVSRNRFVERWAGREWAIRENLAAVQQSITQARKSGDREEAPLFYGQDAGLIRDLPPAARIVERLVAEAEEILTSKLPSFVK
jgi:NAD(P)H-dependent flavin oxidoreductase YrpB (nitropropane dioxygenase family)